MPPHADVGDSSLQVLMTLLAQQADMQGDAQAHQGLMTWAAATPVATSAFKQSVVSDLWRQRMARQGQQQRSVGRGW